MRIIDFTTLSFDCYGTLIDWERGLLQALQPWRARTRTTASDAELLEAFGQEEPAVQARSPDARYPEVLAATLQALGARWQAQPVAEELESFAQSVGDWPPFADSAAALAYLKRHYRLVILSNVDRASFARSMRKLGVDFDHVYTAEDIGSYKPDRRNFEYMLARLREAGVAAGQVLHVAQSLYHDHVPAKALGLATLWVDRRRGRPGSGATPPAAATPDWEVASLAEVVELHRRASA